MLPPPPCPFPGRAARDKFSGDAGTAGPHRNPLSLPVLFFRTVAPSWASQTQGCTWALGGNRAGHLGRTSRPRRLLTHLSCFTLSWEMQPGEGESGLALACWFPAPSSTPCSSQQTTSSKAAKGPRATTTHKMSDWRAWEGGLMSSSYPCPHTSPARLCPDPAAPVFLERLWESPGAQELLDCLRAAGERLNISSN